MNRTDFLCSASGFIGRGDEPEIFFYFLLPDIFADKGDFRLILRGKAGNHPAAAHIIETKEFTGRSGGKESLGPGDISENTACGQIQERHQMDRGGKGNSGKGERGDFFFVRVMLMRMGLPVHFLRAVLFRKEFSFPGGCGHPENGSTSPVPFGCNRRRRKPPRDCASGFPP